MQILRWLLHEHFHTYDEDVQPQKTEGKWLERCSPRSKVQEPEACMLETQTLLLSAPEKVHTKFFKMKLCE